MWTSMSLILFDTLLSSPYKPVHRRGGAHFEGLWGGGDGGL